MLQDILKIVKEANVKLPKPAYVCKYCAKAYTKESSLINHMCEPKRRWQQEHETGVRFGLHSYLRFYEISQGSAKLKTYADFVSSPYYTAFVKFGRHMVGIRAVNPVAFTEWVLKQNKKIDHWCHEAVYVEYLIQYMRKEATQDAMERALIEMQKYADEHDELKSFNDYFRIANPNRICLHIANGRISPWVVYNCDSGIAFLDGLTEEQINIIINWIDPTFWSKKFKDYPTDTDWVKGILKAANL